MTSLLTAILGLAGATAAVTTINFQTPTPVQERGLASVPGQVSGGRIWLGRTPAAPFAQHTVEQWRERLSAVDFEARGQAFDQAVAALHHDRALAEALNTWSADRALGDLAWTAFMVLRQNAHQQLFAGSQSHQPYLLSPGLHRTPATFPFGPGVQGASEGVSIEMNDGRVRVMVDVDGPKGKETRIYAAATLEELKATNPELFETGGALEHMLSAEVLPGVFEHAGIGSFLAPIVPPVRGFPDSSSSMIRTDILGVYVSDFTAKGDKSQALLVDSVVEPSIAWALGLHSGDVIIRVAGQRVRARADIGTAMATVPAGGSFEVEWITKTGKTKTEIWNQAPTSSD